MYRDEDSLFDAALLEDVKSFFSPIYDTVRVLELRTRKTLRNFVLTKAGPCVTRRQARLAERRLYHCYMSCRTDVCVEDL